jgi:hypothetical protein
MSLLGRLARAIWRRFERMPGARGQIAYQKRVVEVSIEAERAAYSSLEDSQAKGLSRLGGGDGREVCLLECDEAA